MEALYFTATWCQPCKIFGPIMEKIENLVKVRKIDVSQDQQSLSYFNIMSVPTVVFLRNGAETGRFVGARTEDWVRDFIIEMGR